MEWLLREREQLEELGFSVPPPQLDDRLLHPHAGRLTVSVADERDWFDLRGEVRVDEFVIPFAKIAKYIRNNDRYYPLPNGRYFLIPREWWAKYGEVAKYGTTEGNGLRLSRAHFPLVQHLTPAGEGEAERAREAAADYQPGSDLKAELRPYQLAGTRWLIEHHHQNLGACLADDMGLGKTLQTIAVLLYAKGRRRELAEQQQAATDPAPQLDLFSAPAPDESFLQPLHALVVLPASLVFNWAAELRQFAPRLTVHMHTGPKRPKDIRILRRYDVILTTYHTALRDKELLAEIEFEYIVLDESQQIKNRGSKLFKAVNELNARHRISLSGTPIENSLADLWSQMQFLNPGLLKGYAFFRKEFQLPIEKANDDNKKDKLRRLVAPYLLRRTKDEVAKDLPELHTQLFYCEMEKEQRKVYEREKSAARNHLLGNYAPQDGAYRLLVVQTLTRLRQLANHPVMMNADYAHGSGKFTEVLEQWETVRKAGHKALFFSSFVKHLELFRAELNERGQQHAWISGSVAAKDRAAAVRRFQEEDELQAFLISIKSGGTGLNLTQADYVFVLDPWWNPTIEHQAIARAHRIGREGTVFARKFISRDTIEEKIVKLQERKHQLAEDIIGKSGKLDLDKTELSFLLE